MPSSPRRRSSWPESRPRAPRSLSTGSPVRSSGSASPSITASSTPERGSRTRRVTSSGSTPPGSEAQVGPGRVLGYSVGVTKAGLSWANPGASWVLKKVSRFGAKSTLNEVY